MRAPAPTVPSTGPMPEVAPSAPPATPRTPPVTLTATQSILTQQMTPTDPSHDPPLAEQTMPLEETTTGEIEASIPSIPTSTAEPSSPHDPPTTI
ncbi:hypothetical protein AAG906_016954 [Vitis piasezkii]